MRHQSTFIQAVAQLLGKFSPRPLACFGRDDTDSYKVVVEPSVLAEQFAPMIWKIVPPGSIYSRYAGWVAFRALSGGMDLTWIGMEAVVKHPTRGVYVEACYGLFTKHDAVNGLRALKTLPLVKDRDGNGKSAGLVRAANDDEVHRTAPTLHASLEAAIRAIEDCESVDCRVPSLGVEQTARMAGQGLSSVRVTFVYFVALFTAISALVVYLSGCAPP